jgi:hypothetical protein
MEQAENQIVYSLDEQMVAVVEESQMGNKNMMSHLTKIAYVANVNDWIDVMTCSCEENY